MPFDSLFFALFLGVTLTLFYALQDWRQRKWLLLVASYLFYAAWSPPMILLIWLSTWTDFFLAAQIAKSETPQKRKRLLVVSLVVNLGLLGYFKYAVLLVDSVLQLTHWFGWYVPVPALDIILPVGISFYTFQTLSYTLDVYRNRIEPHRDWLDFALYVTFFPQLVAGPIVRADHFLPQCQQPSPVRSHQFAWGATLLIFGLFAKIVLADAAMAPMADQVFGTVTGLSALAAWTGLLAFSGEIFFDFSGYSLCAIGVAMMFGFSLPDNFRSPYAAIGLRDFWQRWHISLSTWLRDYLYISLGGNRGGTIRVLRALMITMLLGGLWHGASSWNLLLWGGVHGLLLIGEHCLLPKPSSTRKLVNGWVLALLTFLVVTVAWIPFRAQSVADSMALFKALFTVHGTIHLDPLHTLVVFLVIGFTLIWQWEARDTSLEQRFFAVPSWMRTVALPFMILSVALCSTGDSRAFIYFQF